MRLISSIRYLVTALQARNNPVSPGTPKMDKIMDNFGGAIGRSQWTSLDADSAISFSDQDVAQAL